MKFRYWAASVLLHSLLFLHLSHKPIPAPDVQELLIIEPIVATKAKSRTPPAAAQGPSQPKKQPPGAYTEISSDRAQALEAQEFTYYGFYSRVGEQIRSYWREQLRLHYTDTVESAHFKQRRFSVPTGLRVRCLLTLTAAGAILNVQIVNGSGELKFDEAAVTAIRAAAPFVHPPAGMIDKDGNISMLWAFES